MKVAMIMGSNSDWPKLESAEKVFQEFGIDLEVTVASAHRTPELVKAFAEGARDRGVDVIISAAGVQMPSGIPVAAMAIDGAKNAAIFAVEILSLKYPELVRKLATYRAKMKEEVRAKGEKLAAARASN